MNPTQLLEHHLFPGQNHGEKIARWHNGKAAHNPQLLMGKDRDPAATQLLCPLYSQCPLLHGGAKFAGEAFLIVRISTKQPLRGVCLSSRQGQG